MTIVDPQTFVDPKTVNATSDNANPTHEIETLSDGTFVVVYANGTAIFFQQYDQFGNRIGNEELLTDVNVEDRSIFDIVAVEDGGLVIAYETTTNVIQVQSFDIANGVATFRMNCLWQAF